MTLVSVFSRCPLYRDSIVFRPSQTSATSSFLACAHQFFVQSLQSQNTCQVKLQLHTLNANCHLKLLHHANPYICMISSNKGIK